jgi:hypothetical protein
VPIVFVDQRVYPSLCFVGFSPEVFVSHLHHYAPLMPVERDDYFVGRSGGRSDPPKLPRRR